MLRSWTLQSWFPKSCRQLWAPHGGITVEWDAMTKPMTWRGCGYARLCTRACAMVCTPQREARRSCFLSFYPVVLGFELRSLGLVTHLNSLSQLETTTYHYHSMTLSTRTEDAKILPNGLLLSHRERLDQRQICLVLSTHSLPWNVPFLEARGKPTIVDTCWLSGSLSRTTHHHRTHAASQGWLLSIGRLRHLCHYIHALVLPNLRALAQAPTSFLGKPSMLTRGAWLQTLQLNIGLPNFPQVSASFFFKPGYFSL